MSDSSMGTCDYTTFHGLQCWYVKIMEKYGWIVLASCINSSNTCNKQDKIHKKHKVKCYLTEIESFLRHCKTKITTLNNIDSKQDIQIIHDKIELFYNTILPQLNTLWNKENVFED